MFGCHAITIAALRTGFRQISIDAALDQYCHVRATVEVIITTLLLARDRLTRANALTELQLALKSGIHVVAWRHWEHVDHVAAIIDRRIRASDYGIALEQRTVQKRGAASIVQAGAGKHGARCFVVENDRTGQLQRSCIKDGCALSGVIAR